MHTVNRTLKMNLAKLSAMTLGLASFASTALALHTTEFTVNPSVEIPDANPIGWKGQIPVSDIKGIVSSVSVTLDIRGGYNGDLYGYISSPSGARAVLFNRTGITSANPFGYSDSGFQITLDAGASLNVHEYGLNYTLNQQGQVTGTYAPDGRDIDPESSGASFDSAPLSSNLNIFEGRSQSEVNGIWTLLFADLSGGGQFTLNSVTLQIRTVPEPSTMTLLLSAFALLFLTSSRRRF